MAKSEAGADNNALATFAEDLGRLLGQTERKASEWLNQRQAVAEQLTAVRDKAGELLSELGMEIPFPRRGRPAGKRTAKRAARKEGGRKRRKLSPETRQKMAEAARKRWAARKKAQA